MDLTVRLMRTKPGPGDEPMRAAALTHTRRNTADACVHLGRLTLLLLPVAVAMGLPLWLQSRARDATLATEAAPAVAPPHQQAGCLVCLTAERLGLRMTPFRRVTRYRCMCCGAGVVWPRGRVRMQDLRIVDLDLGDTEEILDRLWEGHEASVEGVPPRQRFGGFEIRRGWRPLHVRVLRYRDLLSDGLVRGESKDAAESMALRTLGGFRFDVPAENLIGGDQGKPFEIRLGLDRSAQLRGCGSPSFSAVLDYVAEDPRLDDVLSRVSTGTADALPWLGALLEAQALFDARYFAGAHESARRVLLDMPNEPHAVALIYATYVESLSPCSSRETAFGSSVLEPIQRMRKRARTVCRLEGGDPRTLR